MGSELEVQGAASREDSEDGAAAGPHGVPLRGAPLESVWMASLSPGCLIGGASGGALGRVSGALSSVLEDSDL